MMDGVNIHFCCCTCIAESSVCKTNNNIQWVGSQSIPIFRKNSVETLCVVESMHIACVMSKLNSSAFIWQTNVCREWWSVGAAPNSALTCTFGTYPTHGTKENVLPKSVNHRQ